jgi:hypothetical protein
MLLRELSTGISRRATRTTGCLKHGTAVFDELKQSALDIEYLSDPRAGELRVGLNCPVMAGDLNWSAQHFILNG